MPSDSFETKGHKMPLGETGPLAYGPLKRAVYVPHKHNYGCDEEKAYNARRSLLIFLKCKALLHGAYNVEFRFSCPTTSALVICGEDPKVTWTAPLGDIHRKCDVLLQSSSIHPIHCLPISVPQQWPYQIQTVVIQSSKCVMIIQKAASEVPKPGAPSSSSPWTSLQEPSPAAILARSSASKQSSGSGLSSPTSTMRIAILVDMRCGSGVCGM